MLRPSRVVDRLSIRLEPENLGSVVAYVRAHGPITREMLQQTRSYNRRSADDEATEPPTIPLADHAPEHSDGGQFPPRTDFAVQVPPALGVSQCQ